MSDANTGPAGSSKVKPSARRKARRFLVQALYQWQMTGSDLNDIEVQFRTDNNMIKTDTVYFHELLHQIPAQVNAIDDHFEKFLDRDKKELDQVELAILRIGTFELAQRLDVPYRVAINEAIELAKIYGATESHKYVNGVLDKVAARTRSAEVNARRRPVE